MSRANVILFLILLSSLTANAQDFNQLTDAGDFVSADTKSSRGRDSLSAGNKEIPSLDGG